MTNKLIPRPTTALSTDLQQLADDARDFIVDSVADNTKKAYASDWAAFVAWCKENRLPPMPATPQTVVLYLTARAKGGAKVASLQRYMASISAAHKTAGEASPTHDPIVKRTMQGIRRKLGTRQTRKAAAVADEVALMVSGLAPSLFIDVRDRALLLLGFACAFRRSELVALNVGDVEFVKQGLIVTVQRSKTDQEGAGATLAVAHGKRPETCPVRALQAWLDAIRVRGDNEPHLPLFTATRPPFERLSDKSVANIVKKHAERAGLDPKLYAGHSLRAGLATTAALKGKALKAIMKQTRHTRVETVMKYIRDSNPFDDNATDDIGL